MNGSPSTHILKPDSPRLPGGVQNEAFCLTLAKRMRIQAPEVTTGRAGNRTYLLVKRYDRTDAGGRCRRLHQEDYCQALSKPPSAKYESNQTGTRGPALKDMFDITRRHMPPTGIVRLLDMVILNVLACNSDAHAKNYSIMIRAGSASLAPMYDIMCGEVWENVTKNLAQKIAGMTRGDHLSRTRWQHQKWPRCQQAITRSWARRDKQSNDGLVNSSHNYKTSTTSRLLMSRMRKPGAPSQRLSCPKPSDCGRQFRWQFFPSRY